MDVAGIKRGGLEGASVGAADDVYFFVMKIAMNSLVWMIAHMTLLYCITLHCTALCVLYRTALYCSALYLQGSWTLRARGPGLSVCPCPSRLR